MDLGFASHAHCAHSAAAVLSSAFPVLATGNGAWCDVLMDSCRLLKADIQLSTMCCCRWCSPYAYKERASTGCGGADKWTIVPASPFPHYDNWVNGSGNLYCSGGQFCPNTTSRLVCFSRGTAEGKKKDRSVPIMLCFSRIFSSSLDRMYFSHACVSGMPVACGTHMSRQRPSAVATSMLDQLLAWTSAQPAQQSFSYPGQSCSAETFKSYSHPGSSG